MTVLQIRDPGSTDRGHAESPAVDPAPADSRGHAAGLLSLLGPRPSPIDVVGLVARLANDGPREAQALFGYDAGLQLEQIAQLWDSDDVADRARLIALLIDLLRWDAPRLSRRALVDLLAEVCRRDFALVVGRLHGESWFIVRNLIIALRHTADSRAFNEVARHRGHDDHRVRVEVIRSLNALEAERSVDDLVAALSDDSAVVRHAAVSLLRATASERVVDALVEVIVGNHLSPEMASAAVRLLAERNQPCARRGLERVASHGPRRLRGSCRRQAARALRTRA